MNEMIKDIFDPLETSLLPRTPALRSTFVERYPERRKTVDENVH